MRGALLDDKTIGCDAETRIGHFTVMEEARLELTLFCPGASCALQHGGFVPREWLAAKGNYGVLNFEFGGLVLSTRAGCKRRFTRGFRVGLVLIYPGCQRLFTRGFRCVRPKAEDGSACGRWSYSSHARKNLWYPGYETLGYLRDLEYRLRQKANVNLYRVSKFSLYFSTPKLVALRKFCSILIVLDCFYLFIFYFEKYWTRIWRCPSA